MLVSEPEAHPRTAGELELVSTEEPDDGDTLLASVADDGEVSVIDEPELERNLLSRMMENGPLDAPLALPAFRNCQVIHTPPRQVAGASSEVSPVVCTPL